MKRLPMLVLLTEMPPLLYLSKACLRGTVFWGYIRIFPARLGFQSKQLLFWCMVLKICNIPIFCLIL